MKQVDTLPTHGWQHPDCFGQKYDPIVDPTDDPKPDAKEDAYYYAKHSSLRLPDEDLRKLYLAIATELNKRDGVRFLPPRKEIPGPSVTAGCESEWL